MPDDHSRPGRDESPTLLVRVFDSLIGRDRSPVGGRSWKPTRTLPILAVGVFGAAFVGVSGPDTETTPAATEIVAEVDALAGIHVNDRVLEWMRRFLTSDRRTFEVFLSREGAFAPLIRAKLAERGMPENLLYLAMIESGFSTRATSPVGAGGVWQFMSPTAKQYGLRVDRWVDERRDPVKATDAALDYLQWLHDRYGSWYLSAAAYNAGHGRVDRVVKRYAGGKKGDEDIYWEIIEHLPRETREYVPKMLAASALALEAERYGFEVRPERAYEYERVWVPGGTTLAAVAAEVGIGVAELRELNPHLIRSVTPPGSSYGLRVPVGRTHDVMAALGSGAPAGRTANN
jgi:membrane-bound lytic murein transglycosylase D